MNLYLILSLFLNDKILLIASLPTNKVCLWLIPNFNPNSAHEIVPLIVHATILLTSYTGDREIAVTCEERENDILILARPFACSDCNSFYSSVSIDENESTCSCRKETLVSFISLSLPLLRFSQPSCPLPPLDFSLLSDCILLYASRSRRSSCIPSRQTSLFPL